MFDAVIRFFDDFFKTDNASDKIHDGEEDIKQGNTTEGEAKILEGTAEEIRESEEARKAEEDEDTSDEA